MVGRCHSISPPPSDDDGARLLANHPYALGSVWRGADRWEAAFRLGAGIDVVTVVTHELFVRAGEPDDVGPPSRSLSPWAWRIDGLDDGSQAGRAESPILADAAAEKLLVQKGAEIYDPTATLRRLDGTTVTESDGE